MPRIVLLEPRRDPRQTLKASLRKHAEVVAVSQIQEALKSISQTDPDIVVVALDLGPGSDMHGLKFAQMTRSSPGGDLRRLIVYGVPEGKSPSPAKVAQLQATYEVDLYIGTNLSPAQLAKDLVAALGLKEAKSSTQTQSGRWRRGSPEVSAFATETAGNLSIKRGLESRAIVTAKVKERNPADESWGEVLRQDVSIKSIRQLLTKDILQGKN
jgi:CheY-like chemotaxis protein